MSREINIEAVRLLVEKLIANIFDLRIRQAEKVHPTFANLWQAIEPMAMAGGKKRIRPYLTVVGYGKIDDEIIKVAAAQELVHLAMLIHDDIIDKDFMRYGQKNVTGRYLDIYANDLGDSELTHFANSAAVLAGDAILSEAYLLLNDARFDEDIKRRITAQMGTSIFEVIAGELMDVEATFRQDMLFDPISIYRYKTASYSLIGPLVSGAYCAGKDEETISVLEKFATIFGIVFQVQDDLLGVYGDTKETGKSTIGDLKEGKRTLLVANHELLMNDAQAIRFETIFGNSDATTEQFEELKTDMIDSGAKSKTTDYIEECDGQIAQHLQALTDEKLRDNLLGLVKSLDSRRF